MKRQNFEAFSKEELLQKEKELKEELFKLNAQRYAGRVEKPHMFSLVRKNIARVQTALRKKKEI